MPRTDRAAALNVAWTALWWLLDPDHDRWGKVREVLNDPTSRLTIDQGSRDRSGRRSIGEHSSPTEDTALAVLDAGLDLKREQRDLQRRVNDVAETAHFIVATMTETAYDADLTLEEAVRSIDWANTIPHTSAAWVTDNDEKRDQFDHAHDHLATSAKSLMTRVRKLLAGAVKERPEPVEQVERRTCRTHLKWWNDTGKRGLRAHLPIAYRHGLCEKCWQFRQDHKVPPTTAILTRWDGGKAGATPGQIMEAKAERKARKQRKGA